MLNIYICHVKLYHFAKGWNAVQSLRDLNELFGEGTIIKSLLIERCLGIHIGLFKPYRDKE